MSQADIYYEAILARDYRFDGKFFVGVKTTGIYCRPICPARPKRENIELFQTATLAENAGYRPCLRCRPECAPLSPAWNGKSAVVQRALKLIASNQLFALNEERFADQFGMSARHLRRLFQQELGQTPKQISDNNRLNFARKLIVETPMSMTLVAETAGFSSLRRFNDAFKKRFARAPLQLRKNKTEAKNSSGIELSLSFRPPYDWETILKFFSNHHIPGVEQVQGNTYERIFKIDDQVGWLQVRRAGASNQLDLRVVVENPRLLFEVVSRIRRMFDLDSDPLLIANSFAQEKILDQLCTRFPGLRLPRGWDSFETAICAILGQLVSVDFSRQLVAQLVENYGEEISHPLSKEKSKIFPTAKRLAQADLTRVKTTGARKQTIREFSQWVVTHKHGLSDAQDPAQFRDSLLNIKGIGPWSAEYIALRAIGDTDAFPASDLILKRVLELHPKLDLQALKPWRSYAAIYLWKGFAASLSKRKEKNL